MGLVQKSFSDIITFSRTSNATRVGPTGVLEYAPHNLILQSQTFDNASWLLIDSSISANSAAAPDGTVTADKLVENTANSNHTVYQAAITTVTATVSVYAKAAGRSNLIVRQYAADTEVVSANFDLSAGTVSKTLNQGTIFSSPLYSIISVGNGWYRCTVTATRSSGTTVAAFDLSNTNNPTFRSGGDVSYTGDGTSGIYLWGAQLAVGPYALDYVPTTSAAVYGPRFDYDGSGVTIVEPVSTNLLLYSQEFENAYWTKGNASITANATAAPDGTTTADKLVENSSNAFHYVGNVGFSVSAQAYTASFYAKAAERTRCFIDFNDGSTAATAYFDLSNGTSSNVSALLTVSINSVGNGWYRITASRVYASATSGAQFTISPTIAAGTSSYTGDGTSGIYIWGAQLEVGSTATAYMVSGASNGFRAVPVVSGSATPKGLLVEEQRQNLVLYSQEFDNAAWTKTNATVTANTDTAPDGTVTADLIYPSSSGAGRGAYQSVVGANTLSFYAKANNINWVALINTTGIAFVAWFNVSTGTVGTVAAGYSASISNVGNGWFRCQLTATSGSFAYFQFVLSNADNSSSVTANGTDGVYLWGAQLEAGSFATSYIPTLASAVTRSADVASVNTLSPWWNNSEGSLFAEFDFIGFQPSSPGVNQGVATFTDGSAATNNLAILGYGGTGAGARTAATFSGSSLVAFLQGSNSAVNTSYKSAFAFAANDYRFVNNGGSVLSDTSGAFPTGINQLVLGNLYTTTNSAQQNGHLRRIAYYPRRLTNAELQALTS